MIRFHLNCDNDHRFESWFQSGAAYDTLNNAGLITCDVCGSTQISKSLMAPMVQTSDEMAKPKPTSAKTTPAVPDEKSTALAALREKVESTSDYVGKGFVKEARAIHDGTAPDRPIYGEARSDEARKLLADGIPVLPLPFIPRKRTH